MNIDIKQFLALEPAVVRGLLTAAVGALASTGLVIVEAESYIGLVVAFLAVVQALSTRKVVSPVTTEAEDDHLDHEVVLGGDEEIIDPTHVEEPLPLE